MVQTKEKRGVGINTFSKVHFTDHLAVVCIIMDIPLLFQNSHDFALAVKQYPGLRAELVGMDDFTSDYLISNYDVLFLSDHLYKDTFHDVFKDQLKTHGKQTRIVFCPHGFSDKGYFLKFAVHGDIVLAYGQNMFDQLEDEGVLHLMENYVLTGNYRYNYYKQNKAHFDALVGEEVFHKFKKKQPVILYAPTRLDKAYCTTFFDCHKEIIGNLPDSYNMIVKPHPDLKAKDPVGYYEIAIEYSGKPNVVFLEDFNLIYPLAANCDIYLGDTSSVGYDFLTFGKPMFFINKFDRDPYSDRGVYLFRCGTEIKLHEIENLYQLIDTNLAADQSRYGKIRKEVYEYSFGEEKPFEQIKKEVIEAYNKPLSTLQRIII